MEIIGAAALIAVGIVLAACDGRIRDGVAAGPGAAGARSVARQ